MGNDGVNEQTEMKLSKRIDTEEKLVQAASILVLESWMMSEQEIRVYSKRIIDLVRKYDKEKRE